MLQWQTSIYVAGAVLTCLESYESIRDRITATGFKHSEESMEWIQPLELTIQGENGPLRAMVAPQLIGYVIEIPEDDRKPVED